MKRRAYKRAYRDSAHHITVSTKSEITIGGFLESNWMEDTQGERFNIPWWDIIRTVVLYQTRVECGELRERGRGKAFHLLLLLPFHRETVPNKLKIDPYQDVRPSPPNLQ